MPPIRMEGLSKTYKDGPRARLHAFDPETGAAIALNGAPVAEHALA